MLKLSYTTTIKRWATLFDLWGFSYMRVHENDMSQDDTRQLGWLLWLFKLQFFIHMSLLFELVLYIFLDWPMFSDHLDLSLFNSQTYWPCLLDWLRKIKERTLYLIKLLMKYLYVHCYVFRSISHFHVFMLTGVFSSRVSWDGRLCCTCSCSEYRQKASPRCAFACVVLDWKLEYRKSCTGHI